MGLAPAKVVGVKMSADYLYHEHCWMPTVIWGLRVGWVIELVQDGWEVHGISFTMVRGRKT